ncbi:hypothetical protein [Yersinia enterocolitica]|uniref:hypothetical protein n=1 Tax=Yersinia enterocolitica TaxID=630 RepID=UPI003F420115
MNNLEELFIANAELAAELLQHMADNEIDSDYFAVVTDSPNCGREVQSEHSVTEVALMAAGIIEQLIAQLEAAQKELSAANEKLLVPVKKFGHNFGKPMGWAVVTNDGMLNGGVHDTERYARAVADSKEYSGKHRVIPLVSAFVEGNADAE